MPVVSDEYVTVFSSDTKGLEQANSVLAANRAQIQENNAVLRAFDGEIATARGQMAELAGKVNDVRTAFGSNSTQVKELQSQYQQLSAAARGLSAAKSQLTLDAKNLKDAEAQAAQKVKELETALKQQQAAAEASRLTFQKISSGIQDVASGMARAGGLISGFVTAPIVAISEMGRSFETELRRVAANTAMTDAELAKMRETVMDLGRNSAAPLADIAHGFEHAANFGFNAAESAKILDVAMQGAVATGAHTTDVTNTLAGVLHQFGMSADQASVTLNTLKEAAGKGNLTLEQMVSVSGRVFSTAANLGLSLNEAAGAMSALTRAGFPAAQASTQLVGALTHLVNPSKEVREELARLSKTSGIDLVHDFSQAGLQAKGFSGVLADVKKAVGDNTAEILKLFGGIRGGMGAMALAGNAADDYKNILNQLAETMAGKLTPIQDAYAREVNTLGFQFGELKNRLTLLGDALNSAFSGDQVNFVKGLNDAVSGLTAGFNSLDPAMKAAVATFLGAFAISGPILLGVGALVALIGGPLTIAIVGVTAALSILAADWLSDNDKAKGSTETLKQSLLELIPALGLVADIMGVVANASFIAWQSSTAQIKATIQVITGDWIGAMRTIDESNKIFSKGLGNIWDELNGKWEGVLNKLVNSAFSASSGFAAAGRANANAYSQSFANIGIGRGAANPFAIAGPAPVKPFTSMWLPGSPESQAAEAAANAAGNRTAAAYSGGFGGGIKKGGGLSKAIVDAFQGEGGFDRALDLIRANVSKLGSLLDPTTKQFRLQGGQIEKALSEAAKNVNEFLGAAGIKAKVTSTDIINNWQGLQGVLSKTDAFEHVKDAIEKINLDRVAAGFDTLDSTLVVSQGHILLSAQTLQALQEKFPPLTAEAQKAGVALQGSLLPIADKTKVVAAGFALLSEETKKTLGDMGKSTSEFSFDTKESLAKAGLSWKELVRGLPVEQLKAALKEMKAAVEGDPIFDAVKIKNEAAQWIDTIIGEFTREGERMGLTGEALMNHALEGLKKVAPSFPPLMKDVADKSVEQWKLSLYRLPGVWDEVFNKMGSQAKSWAASIFGVLDTIPGAFGSTVKKVQDTISQWVSFFNSILGLLHKFSSSIPSSIGDALNKIIGLVKGAQSTILSLPVAANKPGYLDPLGMIPNLANAASGVASAGSQITKATEATSGKFVSGFNAMAVAVGGFAASLGISASAGSKTTGFLGSLASSTISGILAGLQFGPAVGAIVGGISLLGGIIGLFKGKSAAQKEKERLDNEKLKADIAASAQATMNAAIEGFQKALAFFDTLDQFTAPRKAKFQEFWKAMSRLMDGFVELAKKFQNENLTKIKDVADAVGSVAAGVAATPAAFDAINLSFTIPDTQFDIFFSNLDKFMDKFFARSEVWVVGVSKRAKKVADRLASVVGLVAPFTEGLKGLFDLKAVPDDALNVFDQMLERMVLHIGNIADKFDKGWLKTLGFFAEKAQAATDLIKGAVDAIKAVADVQPVSESSINAVVGGIEMFVTKLIAAAESMTAEALGKAASIAQAVLPIAAALKAWVEAAGLAKSYTAVAAKTWDDIKNDFNFSISLMLQMLDQAIRFIPDAIRFEDTMKTIADHLKAGLGFITEGIQAAQSAFLGLVNVMSSPQNPVSGGGDSVGASAFAGLSGGNFAPNSLASSSATTNNATHNHYHFGSLHVQSDDPAVKEAVMLLMKTFGIGGTLEANVAQHS